MARKRRERWSECVDCGVTKTGAQQLGPRCRSCAQKISQNDPELKARMSEILKKTWEDSPERRESLSNRMKEHFADPENRARQSAISRESHASEEVRLKISENTKKGLESEEVRHKMRVASRQQWENKSEEDRKRRSENMKTAMSSEDVKKKMRDRSAKFWSDPENRIRLSLRQGGDGDLERINAERRRSYAISANNLRGHNKWAADVKKRDGHVCRHCDSTENLHAHHVKQRASFPELALVLENGVTLCFDCHVKEHARMREELTQSGKEL